MKRPPEQPVVSVQMQAARSDARNASDILAGQQSMYQPVTHLIPVHARMSPGSPQAASLGGSRPQAGVGVDVHAHIVRAMNQCSLADPRTVASEAGSCETCAVSSGTWGKRSVLASLGLTSLLVTPACATLAGLPDLPPPPPDAGLIDTGASELSDASRTMDAGERDVRTAEGGGHDAQTKEGGQVGKDASTDAPSSWSPVCPENAPDLGSSCSVAEGTTCEYGNIQYDITCDTVFVCESGSWSKFAASGTCVPDGANAPTCPATLADVQQGQDCTPSGTTCQYSAGVCTCNMSLGGPVQIGDAGNTATWTCNPGAGCPMPRPRLGTACSAAENCTYNTCEYSQLCGDGAWRGELEACE
jgi:hypothetical protein